MTLCGQEAKWEDEMELYYSPGSESINNKSNTINCDEIEIISRYVCSMTDFLNVNYYFIWKTTVTGAYNYLYIFMIFKWMGATLKLHSENFYLSLQYYCALLGSLKKIHFTGACYLLSK